jgi:hypothetical protein
MWKQLQKGDHGRPSVCFEIFEHDLGHGHDFFFTPIYAQARRDTCFGGPTRK